MGTEPLRHVWRYASIAALGGVLLSVQAIADWRDDHGLLINTSESLPNWAFFIRKNKAPHRGDYIVFDPPQSPIVVAHFGAHTAAFTKIAYGIAGDVVSRVGGVVFVNSEPVGRLKPLTKLGERLAPGPTGVIPNGCYYVGTPHKDGFDSRYGDIGFICRDRIIGTGEAIL